MKEKNNPNARSLRIYEGKIMENYDKKIIYK